MADLQLEDHSMSCFKTTISPRESWTNKLSSPTQSEDSGIEWSPNPYEVSDFKMELESPTIRHQAVNNVTKREEVENIPYNQVNGMIPSSLSTKGTQWGCQLALPDKHSPDTRPESNLFCNKIQGGQVTKKCSEFLNTTENQRMK